MFQDEDLREVVDEWTEEEMPPCMLWLVFYICMYIMYMYMYVCMYVCKCIYPECPSSIPSSALLVSHIQKPLILSLSLSCPSLKGLQADVEQDSVISTLSAITTRLNNYSLQDTAFPLYNMGINGDEEEEEYEDEPYPPASYMSYPPISAPLDNNNHDAVRNRRFGVAIAKIWLDLGNEIRNSVQAREPLPLNEERENGTELYYYEAPGTTLSLFFKLAEDEGFFFLLRCGEIRLGLSCLGGHPTVTVLRAVPKLALALLNRCEV